jgi:zinc protease
MVQDVSGASMFQSGTVKPRSTSRLSVAFATLIVICSVVEADEGPQFVRAVEGIAEFRLGNGLQVLLFPDESSPKVTINLTVFVGSRHEGYGEAGMAHLLEHMVFKGTPSRPDIPALLKKAGADFNGTTWLDRTNYYETLPAGDENLELGISLEADRMVNSLIRGEDLASEMTVVRNEFEAGENNPQGILMQRMLGAAFEWHNYGKSTIGNRADIERVPVENLRRFYQRFYQPDNALLIIAGQFDPQKALELTQQHFGALPKPERELDRTWTEEPAQDGERLVTLRRVGEVPLAGVAYHIPAGGHPDFVALDVLNVCMASEPAGRLYDLLVKRRIAAGMTGISFGLHDPGVMLFGAQAAQGTDGTTLLQSLIEAVETTGEKPFTAEEVERARQELLRQRELRVASSQTVAIELSDWAAQGDWRLFFVHRDRLEQVTADDVNRVARAYLTRNNRTAGVFEPTAAPERVSIPATPDLAGMIGDYKGREEVARGEEFDATPAGIEARLQRSTLPSGLKVTLLQKKTRGAIVSLRLNLRYGNLDALRNLATACELLPPLMQRGTQNLSRQQISDELNNYRAQLNVTGSPGNLTLSLQTTRENLQPVLRIVQQILREPLLSDEELKLLVEEQIASVSQQVSDPVAIAMSEVTRKTAPYAPEDPRYVPALSEDVERLKSVSIGQLRDVYSRLIGAGTGELTVVGDFDPQQVLPEVERLLNDWKSDVPFARLARESINNTTGDLQKIETPDKANAAYCATLTIPMRDDHPDYPALEIANFILGSDGLSSRLGDRVRQQDGLSYGIQSRLQPNAIDERTVFFLFAICNPANSDKVHAAVQEELTRFVKDGITAGELEAAKSGWLQEQQVMRAEDRALMPLLEAYAFIGRDMTFVARREQQVQELTVEQVNEAIRKHFDPRRLYIISAGDFASTKAGE